MTGQQKTIVISDMHMSNGAGYSWFLPPYPGELTAMLTSAAKDSSVAELILLGDLFDLWLYPLDVIPWTVSQILAANRTITKALRQCVRKIPNMYYMTGNHDMKVVPSDLQPLKSGNKNVQIVTPDWYNAKYQNQRHLEHGHGVDMFNAPDNSRDTIGGYPLGFFIMRLVATAENQSAVWHALHALLQGLGATYRAVGPATVDVLAVGSFFVQAIIILLEKLAKVQDSTPIRFIESELDNKYTVGDIKTHYGSLFSTWFHKYPAPEEFLGVMLAGFLSNGLNWYAKKLLSSNAPPKVVVMGHTHHAESGKGYANDGCWCIPKTLAHVAPPPNYVEIVGQTATLKPWP